MIVTVLALAICLSTVALFPVDIFLVSTILDPATGLRREWATNEAIANMQSVVRVVYYGTATTS
jgi:LMBR1 domain-containing protein 1